MVLDTHSKSQNNLRRLTEDLTWILHNATLLYLVWISPPPLPNVPLLLKRSMFQKNSLKGSLSKVSSSLVPFPSHLYHSCPPSVSFLFFISSLAGHYQPYYSFISQHGSSTPSMAPAISMQPVSWEKRPPSHPPPLFQKGNAKKREKLSPGALHKRGLQICPSLVELTSVRNVNTGMKNKCK